MGKKKAEGRNAASDGRGHRAKAKLDSPAPETSEPAVPAEHERFDAEALRSRVGGGMLAERVLDSIAAAIEALEQSYREVAALGESLALARKQLSEQEDELEAAREAHAESAVAARGTEA